MPIARKIGNYIAETFGSVYRAASIAQDYVWKATRCGGMKEIECMFNDGQIKEGQIIEVTSKMPWIEEGVSETGRIEDATSRNGMPYVRLINPRGRIIEPSFRKWKVLEQ